MFLLLRGHGKVSLLVTPLLLKRSWNVTSIIGSAPRKSNVESAAGPVAAKISVKVHDIGGVTSQTGAQAVIDET